MCSSDGLKACTHVGSLHYFWKLPLRSNNYVLPGLWGHFILIFLPSALNGGGFVRFQMMTMFMAGCAIPFLLAYLSDASTALDEAPALWCLALLPLHLATFASSSRNRRRPELKFAIDVPMMDGADEDGSESVGDDDEYAEFDDEKEGVSDEELSNLPVQQNFLTLGREPTSTLLSFKGNMQVRRRKAL
jgi:hypothetical protein